MGTCTWKVVAMHFTSLYDCMSDFSLHLGLEKMVHTNSICSQVIQIFVLNELQGKILTFPNSMINERHISLNTMHLFRIFLWSTLCLWYMYLFYFLTLVHALDIFYIYKIWLNISCLQLPTFLWYHTWKFDLWYNIHST